MSEMEAEEGKIVGRDKVAEVNLKLTLNTIIP